MKTFKEFINEDTQQSGTFEITDTAGMSKEEAKKTIREHYPHQLTYKGKEFFDNIYMNVIVPTAGKKLGVGKSWEENGERQKIDGQESYLGYLPDEDVFVSGWDMFDDGSGGDHNVVFLKIINNKADKIQSKDGYIGMMYGQHGSYKKLHQNYPQLVDIRLD